ncbi:MAG: hypothetical protein RBR65_02545 [Aliarcobacter sp.]|jgi:hypothetical protein|nr:hypothetical protein [Aliarcobacter sp.]
MGMILGFFLILYVVIAVITYKVIKHFVKEKFIHQLVIVIIFLIPTYDIIITNILAGYYCLTTPSSYINKKDESPKSIYWEDNVYPGFSKEDRELMIINYLDGKHLETMALNGDDGKIYVYNAKDGDYENIINSSKEPKGSYEKYQEYAKFVIQNEKIYTKESMPKMNYTVTFNEIRLPFFVSSFLYSDDIKIMDNKENKEIAYNKRILRFFYNIAPDISIGGRYYESTPMCGELNFQQLVLQTKGISGWDSLHKIDLNKKLFKKYKEGEK